MSSGDIGYEMTIIYWTCRAPLALRVVFKDIFEFINLLFRKFGGKIFTNILSVPKRSLLLSAKMHYIFCWH